MKKHLKLFFARAVICLPLIVLLSGCSTFEKLNSSDPKIPNIANLEGDDDFKLA